MDADDGARDAARAVGAELRRLGELLIERDASAAVLDAVAGRLRTASAELAGEAARTGRRDHDESGSLRGAANPLAPPLRFVPSGREGAVAATARLGVAYEGPPGLVHGGWVAAMFDEVLAVLQRDAGVDGVTAELTVRYRRPTPVGVELRFEGRIDEDAGRSVTASATCLAGGEVVAEADARFVRGALGRGVRPAGR